MDLLSDSKQCDYLITKLINGTTCISLNGICVHWYSAPSAVKRGIHTGQLGCGMLSCCKGVTVIISASKPSACRLHRPVRTTFFA